MKRSNIIHTIIFVLLFVTGCSTYLVNTNNFDPKFSDFSKQKLIFICNLPECANDNFKKYIKNILELTRERGNFLSVEIKDGMTTDDVPKSSDIVLEIIPIKNDLNFIEKANLTISVLSLGLIPSFSKIEYKIKNKKGLEVTISRKYVGSLFLLFSYKSENIFIKELFWSTSNHTKIRRIIII